MLYRCWPLCFHGDCEIARPLLYITGWNFWPFLFVCLHLSRLLFYFEFCVCVFRIILPSISFAWCFIVRPRWFESGKREPAKIFVVPGPEESRETWRAERLAPLSTIHKTSLLRATVILGWQYPDVCHHDRSHVLWSPGNPFILSYSCVVTTATAPGTLKGLAATTHPCSASFPSWLRSTASTMSLWQNTGKQPKLNCLVSPPPSPFELSDVTQLMRDRTYTHHVYSLLL
jgi:hypothetical protein